MHHHKQMCAVINRTLIFRHFTFMLLQIWLLTFLLRRLFCQASLKWWWLDFLLWNYRSRFLNLLDKSLIRIIHVALFKKDRLNLKILLILLKLLYTVVLKLLILVQHFLGILLCDSDLASAFLMLLRYLFIS